MRKIYVFGSLIMDHTTICERPPKDGETIFGTEFQISYGGKGMNQAMMAKRLGADIEMIGALGNDANGEKYKNLLIESGFSLDKIFFKNTSTGISNIVVDKNGQNRIIVVLGANDQFTPEDVLSIKDKIKDDSIFLIQNEIPSETIETIVNLGFEKNATIVLNPAPYKKLSDEILNKVTILTPNETEVAQLFNLKEYDEEKVIEKFDKLWTQSLIVTLGDKGSFFYNHYIKFNVEPHKVDVVDTTGAGDAFNGGLVYGLGLDLSIESSLKIANACGALTIEKKGALISQPSKEEVLSFIEEHKKD